MQNRKPSVVAEPDAETLVARARALIPALRARSAAAEKARQCPRETIDDLRAAGVTRVVQPRRYGGYGMDWDVLCRIAMELGQGCGGQAWAATVLADHPCLAGMFSKQAQDEIWGANPETLVSTSYGPRGIVRRVDGGYALTGRWMFSSGVAHSGWTIVGGFLAGDDGKPRYHFFLVPGSDRSIVDDWDVMGMAASGSYSFDLADAFVPAHRVLDGSLVTAGDPPGASVNPESLHRMPIFGFTGTVLVSVTVGVAIGMVKEFEAMLREGAGAAPGRPGTEDMMARAAEASAEVECARLLVLESARNNMVRLRAGHRLDEGDAALTSRNSAYVAKLVKQAATRLMEACGGSGLATSGYMQRAFRDIFAGTAHTTLNWGRSNARYGHHLAGWPPQSPI